jgi:hypothetical protein
VHAARIICTLWLCVLLGACGGKPAARPAAAGGAAADSEASAAAPEHAPYAAASVTGAGPRVMRARAPAGASRTATASLPLFTLFGWVSPPNDSTTPARIAEMADLCLNVAMPAWSDSGHLADNLRRIRYAAAYGIRCLAWDDRFDRIYNDGEGIALLDTIVADYANEPGFLGYYFTDEPPESDFPLLAKIYADLRARDPIHPAYDNMNGVGVYPDRQGYEDFFQRFIDAVHPSVLCNDYYDFTTAGDRGRFVENLVALRNLSNQSGIPFWTTVLLVEHGPYRGLTHGELRWEIAHALAYGARGVGYFTYWTPAPDPKWNWRPAVIGYDGVRTPWFDFLAGFNPAVRAAGETLAGLTWISTQHAGSVPRSGAPFVPDDWIHGVTGRAAIGRFAGAAGERYVLLANSDSLAARDIGLLLPRTRRAWKRAVPARSWSELRAVPEEGGRRVTVTLEAGDFALLRLDVDPDGPVLSVGPNPARGLVRFAVSEIAPGARLEIVDTMGRRVWSSALTPRAAPVVWTGERESGGRARPGIYFARVTAADGLTFARFAWLGSR